MGFRLVSNRGTVSEPAAINMSASGVLHQGDVVDFSRTGGAGVYPASIASTVTNIFGVVKGGGPNQDGYVQGASDVSVDVIPFAPGQIWEADCVNAATTAQVGLRFSLGRTRGDNALYNIATDSTTATAIFRAIAMVGSTSGSGKLLGYFRIGDTTPGSLGPTFDAINF